MKVDRGKVVVWEGADGVDAARRYAGALVQELLRRLLEGVE
ncbi:MAG: hypothetical protein Q8O76_02040 [Chloroflexota bacterium]|nr:hypothetical protein [Chloroflexota bacterium]